MRKLDDLDIAFGSGSIFGAGVALSCMSVAVIIKHYKRFKLIKAAQKRLFEEIDRDIEQEEKESF